MTSNPYGKPATDLINSLFNSGIRNFSLIMRHSARHYDEDIQMEPFMPLTAEGKSLSMEAGKNLPPSLNVRFFSSYIGRCIETAYMMDKGCSSHPGRITGNNIVTKDISPFYVLDLEALLKIITGQKTETFIRNWLDGKIPETTVMKADEGAEKMFSFMLKGLEEQKEPTIDICVTHDWNIYLLKEPGLGLPHEKYGAIEYLEGIVLFRSGDEIFIAHSQAEPKPFIMPRL